MLDVCCSSGRQIVALDLRPEVGCHTIQDHKADIAASNLDGHLEGKDVVLILESGLGTEYRGGLTIKPYDYKGNPFPTASISSGRCDPFNPLLSFTNYIPTSRFVR